jgi:hypothetical protein
LLCERVGERQAEWRLWLGGGGGGGGGGRCQRAGRGGCLQQWRAMLLGALKLYYIR